MRINALHGPDMYAEMSTQRVQREVQSASKADVAKMRSVLFYAIKYLRFSKNNQTVYNMRVTPKTAVSYRRRLETLTPISISAREKNLHVTISFTYIWALLLLTSNMK